jgi:hypothetical protein
MRRRLLNIYGKKAFFVIPQSTYDLEKFEVKICSKTLKNYARDVKTCKNIDVPQ